MEKLFIKNRKEQNISVLIEVSPEQKGLAFVMHGLGGTKEELHISKFAETFRNNRFTVVRFDTTNTFGESDGQYADATTTNYYEDLEDVIGWVATQPFYQEPFYLVGHSLGGISTALYAEKYPDKVKALAPIATVVSGKLSCTCDKYSPEIIAEWKRTGWLDKTWSSTSGKIKRIKWQEMEDRLRYDLLDKVEKLTMPVLMIVGSKDESTPPKHQKILYDALPGQKEMHIIEGAPHVFKEQKHLDEITAIFDHWIKDTNGNN